MTPRLYLPIFPRHTTGLLRSISLLLYRHTMPILTSVPSILSYGIKCFSSIPALPTSLGTLQGPLRSPCSSFSLTRLNWNSLAFPFSKLTCRYFITNCFIGCNSILHMPGLSLINLTNQTSFLNQDSYSASIKLLNSAEHVIGSQ